jgi:hypothetical protein
MKLFAKSVVMTGDRKIIGELERLLNTEIALP